MKCRETIFPLLLKTGILYFTTCFHGFGILRHVDPFVRMLHIWYGVVCMWCGVVWCGVVWYVNNIFDITEIHKTLL